MNGKGNALDQVRTTKSYLSFRHENNTISFTQLGNLPFKEGEQVPIVYQKTNPADAHVDSFMCIWGATAFYVGVPLLMLFITAIHPDIVPYSSRIRVSIKKPFFQIVSKEN